MSAEKACPLTTLPKHTWKCISVPCEPQFVKRLALVKSFIGFLPSCYGCLLTTFLMPTPSLPRDKSSSGNRAFLCGDHRPGTIPGRERTGRKAVITKERECCCFLLVAKPLQAGRPGAVAPSKCRRSECGPAPAAPTSPGNG